MPASSLEVIIAEGDTVATRVVWRGVHKGPWRSIAPTGKRIEFCGMIFWRICDGKIAERWAEVDFASPERQLKGGGCSSPYNGPTVIARSEATKQSISPHARKDGLLRRKDSSQ